MSEDRSSHEPSERSWLERLAQAFAPEPDSREDLLEMLEIARENKVIDRDAAHIIEGAVQKVEKLFAVFGLAHQQRGKTFEEIRLTRGRVHFVCGTGLVRWHYARGSRSLK